MTGLHKNYNCWLKQKGAEETHGYDGVLLMVREDLPRMGEVSETGDMGLVFKAGEREIFQL